MDLHNNDYIKPYREGIKIALIYLVISIVWFIFSDYILVIQKYRFVKGIIFIIANALMIFFLVYRSLNKIRNLDMAIERKNNIINLKSMVLDEIRDDLQKQQNIINILNNYDSLTGLPKPQYLENKFNNLIEKDSNSDYAFLYINIDNFNQVNEISGYRAGDNLLISVGEIIQNSVENKDMISRINNDNFLIILENVQSDDQIRAKVERLQELLRVPWVFEKEKFFISSTIGISTMKRDGMDFDTLIKKASTAMKYCKKNNRAGYHFYKDSIQEEVLGNITMLSEIKKAIINKEFTLHYQIVYDMKNNRIHGVESLIRWFHPTRGYISPMDFIPLAETTDLISHIRDMVLDMALNQKKIWNDMNLNISKIGVNLSSISFDSKDLVELIESKLKKYNILANELVLEITGIRM